MFWSSPHAFNITTIFSTTSLYQNFIYYYIYNIYICHWTSSCVQHKQNLFISLIFTSNSDCITTYSKVLYAAHSVCQKSLIYEQSMWTCVKNIKINEMKLVSVKYIRTDFFFFEFILFLWIQYTRFDGIPFSHYPHQTLNIIHFIYGKFISDNKIKRYDFLPDFDMANMVFWCLG